MFSVADLIANTILKYGPSTVFTLPGSSCLPILDSLNQNKLSVTLMRSETAAAHAAHGLAAMEEKKFGLCILSRGPGAINGMCGMITACEGYPVLMIAGDNSRNYRGRGVVTQDVPIHLAYSTLFPTFTIENANSCYEILGEILTLLLDKRQSVVLIVPSDVQKDVIPEGEVKKPAPNCYQPRKSPFSDTQNCIDKIHHSNRPFIIWGRQALRDDSLRYLIRGFMDDLPYIDCAVTMKGLEYFPLGCRGIIGTQGHPEVNTLQNKSDCIIIIGENLGAEATGVAKNFEANRNIISFVLSGERQKHIKPDYEIVVEKNDIITLMKVMSRKDWPRKSQNMFKTSPTGDTIDKLTKVLHHAKDNSIITLDSGQNFFWAAHALASEGRFRIIYSYSQSTLGFSLPAAIGIASSISEPVIAIIGDGGLLMSLSELDTIVIQKLPIKIILLDNAGLGMVRQTQSELQMSEVGTQLPSGSLVNVANAFGLNSLDISSETNNIYEYLSSNEPVLFRILVDPKRKLIVRGSVNSPLPCVKIE